MIPSRFLIIISYFLCFSATYGSADNYDKKKIGIIKDNGLTYNAFLSFKARPGIKIFINEMNRNLVFYNPSEETIQLKAQARKVASWAFKLSAEVRISYENEDADSYVSLPNLPRTIFKEEGIYTFSEQSFCTRSP